MLVHLWKSNFKQQLGCRFDIMDNISYFLCVLTYAIIYVLIHQIIFRFYLLKYSLFFSNTLVLTSSIDVVFILSIISVGITIFHKSHDYIISFWKSLMNTPRLM